MFQFRSLLTTFILCAWLNNASAESIAPIDLALTFSQTPSSPSTHSSLDTLLITSATTESVDAINLSQSLGQDFQDPLLFVRHYGHAALRKLSKENSSKPYPKAKLKIPTVIGNKHIAAGTNYLAHREEAQMDSGFLFPKYSEAMPSGKVKTSSKVLLDYEVELCVRFDRTISVMQDFEAATKGFFVCGDMTDRATLLRNVNVANVASGHGFTDAKSGNDRFPVGVLTIVPVDWRSLIPKIDLQTRVNGTLRQQSTADKMVKDVEALVADSLQNGGQDLWLHKHEPVPLLPTGSLTKHMVLITGTPEGVTYQGIGTWQKMSGMLSWIFSGDFIDQPLSRTVIETVIQQSLDNKGYLQPGDTVTLSGTYLGDVQLLVTD